MTLIIVQTVFQSVTSTLYWLGFYSGIRALPSPKAQRWAWAFGSAAFASAWLLGTLLLASNNSIGRDTIPLALGATLLSGYLLLLSKDFRAIIASIPPHWLIAIQTFRVYGGIFLIRWWQGEAPAAFAIPAGIGDVLTGLLAPLVAYWWYTGKPYARTAAILWNLFGIADLINALAMGYSLQGAGMVFPVLMIPLYSVPRALLIHSYSLIGLLKGTAKRRSSAGTAEIAAAA